MDAIILRGSGGLGQKLPRLVERYSWGRGSGGLGRKLSRLFDRYSRGGRGSGGLGQKLSRMVGQCSRGAGLEWVTFLKMVGTGRTIF